MYILEFFDDHSWLTTLLMVPSTVGLAVWQINRQFRNTIKAQKTNKLDELHLSIYKEIAEKIEICQKTLSKAYATTLSTPSFFEIKVLEDNKARASGLSESVHSILQRYPAIAAEQSDAMNSLADVLFMMDKYEITFTDFATMKLHIRESSTKLSAAMSAFHSYILQYLPMDVKADDQIAIGGIKIINQSMPDATALAKIRILSNAAVELNMDLTSYLHDLRIEAQNVLLSPIFSGKQAPKRVPGDSRFHVLTRDAAKK